MTNEKTRRLTLTAMFMALGMVLPFLTGQLHQIGSMLLPMHIPVFLCALICGWRYGAPMAFFLPVLRSAAFGMPIMYPKALGMAFELMTYALIAGLLYEKSSSKSTKTLIICLLISMLAGRVVRGVVMVILMGIAGDAFTWQMFIGGSMIKAIPGIALQLIIIPLIMRSMHEI